MGSILLGEISAPDIDRCLRGAGLGLQVGTFRCLVRSDTGCLAEPLRLLYRDYPAATSPEGFYDFRILLKKKRGNLWGGSKVEFEWAGHSPFPPLPLAQTHPLFEWGLNWCVATLSGCHTVIHSAVVERDGRALVMPGAPGSGKSTLCAALALAGWRLLSDELTIVSQTSGAVEGVPRPISLKDGSIDIIRSRFPAADLTQPVVDTRKGTIAYVRPPLSALEICASADKGIGHIVFPRFRAGAALTVEPISHAMALAELLENTFNVGLLGVDGFQSLAGVVAQAECYAVEYGDLSDVTAWIDTTCKP